MPGTLLTALSGAVMMGARGMGPRLENAMHRRPVGKHVAAKQFKRQISRTKAVNLKAGPMRGGIRL